MKISRSTLDIIHELSDFSGQKLHNVNDVSFLLESSVAAKQDRLFDDIIFNAKYLNGLGKILHDHMTESSGKNGAPGTEKMTDESFDKVRSEFKDHMKKFSLQLTALIKDTEETERKEFEEKYLSMNQQSIVNLTTLIYDLSWMKKFRNRKDMR
jgi:hypothetical protein